ncbi:MAG: hypothetical protein A2Y07_07375 [Planctomycetes bacterium GWF2_50_10]|nr:MAG: hypothetical protein A2Y07_07375 [Planctomycetes bacterium GWF2_50_10]
MRYIYTFVVMLCVTGMAGAVENGSFEDGLTDWEVSGYSAETAPQFTANFRNPEIGVTVEPVDGLNLAVLKSGDSYNRSFKFSQISQMMTFETGDILSGSYFFATSDYLRWDDFATVTLVPLSEDGGLTEILLAHKDVAAVGDFGSMDGWDTFEQKFDLSNAGTYTLNFRVEDFEDYLWSSYLVIDDVKVTSVPEPATMCLFALGGVALGRRQKTGALEGDRRQ